ncbi:hypothetical protein ACLESD_30335, partial [Pyxidicoccus sp. 3LFB2]
AATGAGVGLGLMPCFQGDTTPGLRRVLPPVAALRRDIWLVVHPDLQQSARVRAVLGFLSEVIQRDRPLMAGGGLLPAAGSAPSDEAESRVRPPAPRREDSEATVRKGGAEARAKRSGRSSGAGDSINRESPATPSGGTVRRGKASRPRAGQARRGKARTS